MSPYKSFIAASKNYFNSKPILRFALSAHAVIFSVGVLSYLLGAFLINIQSLSAWSVYDALTSVGIILACIGLIFSIFAEDAMVIAIVSGIMSLGALIAWIILIASGMPFMFAPLLYFLVFGAVTLIDVICADKFKEMRAASAAARPQGVPCQRCGNIVPFGSGFCPACGAPAPQYAPPQPPLYAPPQMQYAPPQAPPQYAPPAPPPAPSAAPEAAAKKCVTCGTDLPVDAVFCGKCGSKQE